MKIYHRLALWLASDAWKRSCGKAGWCSTMPTASWESTSTRPIQTGARVRAKCFLNGCYATGIAACSSLCGSIPNEGSTASRKTPNWRSSIRLIGNSSRSPQPARSPRKSCRRRTRSGWVGRMRSSATASWSSFCARTTCGGFASARA